MRSLYSGSIEKERDPLSGQHYFLFTTPDELVFASLHPYRPKETMVHIKELHRPKSAQHWTVFQAYRARGGEEFDSLNTEVPGLRAYQEWSSRSRSTAGDSGNFTAVTSEGSGNDQTSRLFRGVTGNMKKMFDSIAEAKRSLEAGDDVGFEIASGEYREAAIASDRSLHNVPPELPHTHTEFYARGDSLPAAARVMASNYGGLLFRDADDDPELVVAHALGVRNLDYLDIVWEGAMAQRTPLAAGQFVLRALA